MTKKKKTLRDVLNNITLKAVLKGSTTMQSNSDDNLVASTMQGAADNIAKEQEAAMFTRKNILVNEFQGEAPIVYKSHFGTRMVGDPPLDENGNEIPDHMLEKSDIPTIRMQDQYGYEGKDATKAKEDEDEIADNVDRLEKTLKLVVPKSNTANFLSKDQQFDTEWQELKKKWGENAKFEE